MNKENYKRAFSAVHPSDKTVERILEMPENKQKKAMPRKLVMVLAILTTITGGMLTANAATDGAVLDGTLFKDIRMVIDGKEANAADYITEHKTTTDKEGNKVDTYEIAIPDDTGDDTQSLMSAVYTIVADGDYTGDPTIEIDTDKQEATLSMKIEETMDADKNATADNSATHNK